MILIFCISNLSVPITINLIKESNEQFVVATDQDNIYQLFVDLYSNENVIKINKHAFPNTINRFNFLHKLLQTKRNLWKQFKYFNNYDIYFFHVAFGQMESWLISKLSKNNKVVFIPAVDISYLPKVKGISAFLKKCFIKLIYNVEIEVLKSGKSEIMANSKSFVKKIGAFQRKYSINEDIVSSFIAKKYNLQAIEILFLTGGIIETKLIDKDEFVHKNDELILALDKNSILLKLHPRFNILHSEEKNLRSIDQKIPANLLIYNTRVAIGYCTASLFEAANSGKIAISLLNYFTPLDSVKRDNYIEYLNSNLITGKKIYFPESLNTIKKIILNDYNNEN